MAHLAPSFDQPHDRSARLHLLGLDEPTLEETVTHGLLARRSRSPFSPRSYPGFTQWAETTIALRQLLAPRDWKPDESNGFPLVVSPDGAIALIVATGDERTGIATEEPATKYGKGPETAAVVKVNEQLAIPGLGTRSESAGDLARRETWALLVCTTEFELRYELSCPKGQAADGRVVAWSSRIILDPIDIESLPGRDRADGPDDGDDGIGGIDVPVERI